jgi:copper chaperone CopZ
MKVGDEVQVTCNYCNKEDKKHINRIDAVVDILFALIISAVVAVVLLSFYGLIALAVISIPLLIWVQESKSTNHFNSYKIRRK